MTKAEHLAAYPSDTTLDRARRGDEMEVTLVDDDQARVTAIRFGIAEGSKVTCVTRIPAGPIVLKSGRQEIAVGRNLAKRICVRPCPLESGTCDVPCEGC